MKLTEIEERMDAIRAELVRIEKNPAATEETDGDMVDTLLDEFEALKSRRDPLAERAKKLDLIQYNAENDPSALEGPDPARNGGSRGPDVIVRQKHDPFEGVDEIRRGEVLLTRQEKRDRGLWAIERAQTMGQLDDPKAEEVVRKIDEDSWTGEIAKHVLLTGSDEYLDAYRAYLRDPDNNMRRAALSLTNSNGGYLLPYVLDPTIILTNTGSANPWRRISRVVTTTSNAWQGVNSAGVNAGWLAEGTAVTDGSPTVGQIQIKPSKAAAWVYGSFEVLADTDFGQQLPGLLADAKDRLEEAAFATGTGTAQPSGVINGATNVITAATTGAYVLADVYSTHGTLTPRFRTPNTAAWVMNVAIINKTRQFDTAGGSSFWTNLGLGQPEQLLGKRVEESTTMVSTLTTGSKIVVFGDFNQFIIVDRVGVSLLYEPLVKSTSTASPNFPTGQAGWFMFWRVSSAVATANAFVVLTT